MNFSAKYKSSVVANYAERGFNNFSNKEKTHTIITIGGEDDMELKMQRADFIAKTLKENGVQGTFDYKYVNDKNAAFQIMSVPEGDE